MQPETNLVNKTCSVITAQQCCAVMCAMNMFYSWMQNVLLTVNTAGICSIFTAESKISPVSNLSTISVLFLV